MHVPADRVVDAGQIARTADMGRERLAVEPGQRTVAVSFLKFVLVATEFRHLPGLDGHMQLARPPVAVDGIALDAFPQQVDCLQRHRPQAFGVGQRAPSGQRLHVAGIARNDLPAAPPGGAPANLPAFQHDDRVAALGQLQRCREARNATADHAHVALLVPAQAG